MRLTADNELVVIHDATVDRTTNGSGKVSEHTLAEIQALDARSMHSHWPEPVRVPLLADVLETLRPINHMEIEIKHDEPERLQITVPGVIRAMRAVGQDVSAVITSLDPYALELAKAHAPEIKRALVGDWSHENMWYLSERLSVSRACMNLGTATPELVQRAKERGYTTVGWPCNDEFAVRKLLEYEFDAACTDAPSIFAPLLGKPVNR